MSTASRSRFEIRYPESDGKPMGETGIHVNSTIELFTCLKWTVFKDRPDVYVTADMFFYYEEGNPKAVKAPDIMVIKGVSHPEERRTFKLWVEGVVPTVIFEVTSAKTRRDDVVIKRELYARLGVAEYYLFDPLGEYLKPRFQGLRLAGDHYDEVEPDPQDGSIISPELGFRLRPVGNRLNAYDLGTGRKIPGAEDYGILIAEHANLEKARENLERVNQAEKQDRENLEMVADAERQRADALEAELNRLRAMLGEGGKPPVT